MDGWIIIRTIIDNKEFNLNYKKLKTQIKGMGKGIANFLKNSFKSGLGAAKGVLSIIGVIAKSIFKIGFAIVGITAGIALLISGALILSKAFERVFKENEQIKANLDYMKFALIKALEPAINAVADVLVKIINFLAKIMQYTAYIIKAWTGYNIFETATPEAYAKYFEEAQNSSKKTAKNAKEIKNQLAGFDEMNVLQDTSSSNKEKQNGFVAPDLNFSNIDNMETPEWLEAIVNIGKWILNNWEEVVFTLLLTKMFIDLLTGNWVGVVIDLIGLLIIAFKKIWENLKIIIETIEPYFKKFVDWISKNVIKSIGDFFDGLWNGITIGVKSAVDNIKKFFQSIPTFFENIVNQIWNLFKNIGTSAGNVIGGAFKSVVNGILNAIENILNTPIKTINSLINVINGVPGIKLGKLSTFKLPRLAKGGIINMPNRGVPLTSAIGGESGREGVIPLTDSQQMALLGEAIGKYITVNVTIVNSMNGRVLNRELQKIQNQSSFATNGR